LLYGRWPKEVADFVCRGTDEHAWLERHGRHPWYAFRRMTAIANLHGEFDEITMHPPRQLPSRMTYRGRFLRNPSQGHEGAKTMTNERLITIETDCNRVFKMHPSEMTDRQLKGLLERNADNNCDPLDMTALRDELQRRYHKR
jgi:hypothetical protein